MSLNDFLCFHREVFVPVYADLVGYLGDKPRQVLVEIENVFSHLLRHLDQEVSPPGREENIEKAYNHLIRVTIDCYKILWIEVKNGLVELNDIVLSCDTSDPPALGFFEQKQKFKSLSMKARAIEMSLIGNGPEACISKYQEVIDLGWNILRNFKNNLIAYQVSKFKAANVDCTGEEPPADYRSHLPQEATQEITLETTIDEGIQEL